MFGFTTILTTFFTILYALLPCQCVWSFNKKIPIYVSFVSLYKMHSPKISTVNKNKCFVRKNMWEQQKCAKFQYCILVSFPIYGSLFSMLQLKWICEKLAVALFIACLIISYHFVQYKMVNLETSFPRVSLKGIR